MIFSPFFLLKTSVVGTDLTTTHNLCFGTKIRKSVYPCIPQVQYIKVGFKMDMG